MIVKNTRLTNKSINKYQFYCLTLTIGVCINGSLKNQFLTLLILIGFSLMIFNPEYLLGPLFFLTIFDDYLLVLERQSLARILVIFFVLGLIIKILIGRFRIIYFKFSLGIILLALLGIVLSLYSIFSFTSFPISYVTNLVLCFFMINFNTPNYKDVFTQMKTYSILSLLYTSYLLIKNGLSFITEDSRMIINEAINTNQLAMGLALVVVILYCCFFIEDYRNKVFYLISIGFSFVLLFLTGSRSGLFAAFGSIVLIILILTPNNNKKGLMFFFFGIFLIMLFIVFSVLNDRFPGIMDRFTISNVVSSGGTGRVAIWKTFFRDLFPIYWSVGIGFDPMNFIHSQLLTNGFGHGSHNIIIEILSKTGFIGLVVFFSFFYRYFKTFIPLLGVNPMALLSIGIVMTSLLNGIGEDILTGRFIWFGVGIGFILINHHRADYKRPCNCRSLTNESQNEGKN